MLAEFNKLPQEGENIGPYLLLKKLSTSILGNFYLATHKEENEKVLLHVIPEALLRVDTRFQDRYREVVEQQKHLPKGPVLAGVELNLHSGHLVVRYPGENYVSMTEFITKAKEPLPEERVRNYLKSLAVGLSDAAKIDQGHYFMTPDFLFLDEKGEIRVGGIGLFQCIQYEAFERFVSGAVKPIQVRLDKNFTSIEILSPEIRNFKAQDQRSDFYCLGMCTYYMLTGFKPARNWEIPTAVRKEINGGWDLFISHCLEPRSSDRFSHYRSFLRDLDNLEELTKQPRKESGQLMRTLDRIPLPEKLEKRLGTQTQLLLRLLLLGVAGVLTVGTAYLFHQILVTDLDLDTHGRQIMKVTDPDQANLVFEVSPPRAIVVVSGPESGRFMLFDDLLLLKGKSGAYRVEVSAPNRQTERFTINLKASEPFRKAIGLTYEFTSVRFEGAVGTDVYVELESGLPIYLGTIRSEEGLLIEDRLLRDEFVFRARHTAYHPARTEPVALKDSGTRVQFDQVPRPSELVVQSDPPGAAVYVDDAIVGVTPLSIEGLSGGRSLSVRVEKEGYRTVSETLEFARGESRVFDVGSLVERIGFLEYTLDLPGNSPPPSREFNFLVGDTEARIQESGKISLPEGTHSIQVEHPDYFPFRKEVEVKDESTTSLEIALQTRPMKIRPVLMTDSPVQYEVNDEVAELTGDGFLLVPSVAPAKVEVSIRDYHSVIQWFVGDPNEVVDWDVPLKALPGPKFGEDYAPPYFKMPLVWIDPVRFNMGSPIDEYRRLPNEDNRTTVRLENGYWIGKFEVTQDTYSRVMNENPSRFKGDQLPVDSVAWGAANAFCARLTEFERNSQRLPDGYVYRLPTEAEWEWATRAGTESAFSFGDTADPSRGNFHGFYTPGESVGRVSEDHYGTRPVGSYDPNPFGLQDVHGNVAEWTVDRYWDRHPGGAVSDPYNGSRGRGYTLRGGSWQDSADRVRSAAREGVPGDTIRNSIGFRVVLAPSLSE